MKAPVRCMRGPLCVLSVIMLAVPLSLAISCAGSVDGDGGDDGDRTMADLPLLGGISVSESPIQVQGKLYLEASWNPVPGASMYELRVSNAAITESEEPDGGHAASDWEDIWRASESEVAVYLSMSESALLELYPQVLAAFGDFMVVVRGGRDTADRDDSVVLTVVAHGADGQALAKGSYNLYRQALGHEDW